MGRWGELLGKNVRSVEALLGVVEEVASSQRPYLAVVSGPSGVGKTRVVQELYEELVDRQPPELRAWQPGLAYPAEGVTSVARADEARKRVDGWLDFASERSWNWLGVHAEFMSDGRALSALFTDLEPSVLALNKHDELCAAPSIVRRLATPGAKLVRHVALAAVGLGAASEGVETVKTLYDHFMEVRSASEAARAFAEEARPNGKFGSTNGLGSVNTDRVADLRESFGKLVMGGDGQASRPTILVLDDAHALGRSSLEALEQVVEPPEGAPWPLLIIATTRPSELGSNRRLGRSLEAMRLSLGRERVLELRAPEQLDLLEDDHAYEVAALALGASGLDHLVDATVQRVGEGRSRINGRDLNYLIAQLREAVARGVAPDQAWVATRKLRNDREFLSYLRSRSAPEQRVLVRLAALGGTARSTWLGDPAALASILSTGELDQRDIDHLGAWNESDSSLHLVSFPTAASLDVVRDFEGYDAGQLDPVVSLIADDLGLLLLLQQSTEPAAELADILLENALEAMAGIEVDVSEPASLLVEATHKRAVGPRFRAHIARLHGGTAPRDLLVLERAADMAGDLTNEDRKPLDQAIVACSDAHLMASEACLASALRLAAGGDRGVHPRLALKRRALDSIDAALALRDLGSLSRDDRQLIVQGMLRQAGQQSSLYAAAWRVADTSELMEQIRVALRTAVEVVDDPLPAQLLLSHASGGADEQLARDRLRRASRSILDPRSELSEHAAIDALLALSRHDGADDEETMELLSVAATMRADAAQELLTVADDEHRADAWLLAEEAAREVATVAHAVWNCARSEEEQHSAWRLMLDLAPADRAATGRAISGALGDSARERLAVERLAPDLDAAPPDLLIRLARFEDPAIRHQLTSHLRRRALDEPQVAASVIRSRLDVGAIQDELLKGLRSAEPSPHVAIALAMAGEEADLHSARLMVEKLPADDIVEAVIQAGDSRVTSALLANAPLLSARVVDELRVLTRTQRAVALHLGHLVLSRHSREVNIAWAALAKLRGDGRAARIQARLASQPWQRLPILRSLEHAILERNDHASAATLLLEMPEAEPEIVERARSLVTGAAAEDHLAGEALARIARVDEPETSAVLLQHAESSVNIAIALANHEGFSRDKRCELLAGHAVRHLDAAIALARLAPAYPSVGAIHHVALALGEPELLRQISAQEPAEPYARAGGVVAALLDDASDVATRLGEVDEAALLHLPDLLSELPDRLAAEALARMPDDWWQSLEPDLRARSAFDDHLLCTWVRLDRVEDHDLLRRFGKEGIERRIAEDSDFAVAYAAGPLRHDSACLLPALVDHADDGSLEAALSAVPVGCADPRDTWQAPVLRQLVGALDADHGPRTESRRIEAAIALSHLPLTSGEAERVVAVLDDADPCQAVAIARAVTGSPTRKLQYLLPHLEVSAEASALAGELASKYGSRVGSSQLRQIKAALGRWAATDCAAAIALSRLPGRRDAGVLGLHVDEPEAALRRLTLDRGGHDHNALHRSLWRWLRRSPAFAARLLIAEAGRDTKLAAGAREQLERQAKRDSDVAVLLATALLRTNGRDRVGALLRAHVEADADAAVMVALLSSELDLTLLSTLRQHGVSTPGRLARALVVHRLEPAEIILVAARNRPLRSQLRRLLLTRTPTAWDRRLAVALATSFGERRELLLAAGATRTDEVAQMMWDVVSAAPADQRPKLVDLLDRQWGHALLRAMRVLYGGLGASELPRGATRAHPVAAVARWRVEGPSRANSQALSAGLERHGNDVSSALQAVQAGGPLPKELADKAAERRRDPRVATALAVCGAGTTSEFLEVFRQGGWRSMPEILTMLHAGVASDLAEGLAAAGLTTSLVLAGALNGDRRTQLCVRNGLISRWQDDQVGADDRVRAGAAAHLLGAFSMTSRGELAVALNALPVDMAVEIAIACPMALDGLELPESAALVAELERRAGYRNADPGVAAALALLRRVGPREESLLARWPTHPAVALVRLRVADDWKAKTSCLRPALELAESGDVNARRVVLEYAPTRLPANPRRRVEQLILAALRDGDAGAVARGLRFGFDRPQAIRVVLSEPPTEPWIAVAHAAAGRTPLTLDSMLAAREVPEDAARLLLRVLRPIDPVWEKSIDAVVDSGTLDGLLAVAGCDPKPGLYARLRERAESIDPVDRALVLATLAEDDEQLRHAFAPLRRTHADSLCHARTDDDTWVRLLPPAEDVTRATRSALMARARHRPQAAARLLAHLRTVRPSGRLAEWMREIGLLHPTDLKVARHLFLHDPRSSAHPEAVNALRGAAERGDLDAALLLMCDPRLVVGTPGVATLRDGGRRDPRAALEYARYSEPAATVAEWLAQAGLGIHDLGAPVLRQVVGTWPRRRLGELEGLLHAQGRLDVFKGLVSEMVEQIDTARALGGRGGGSRSLQILDREALRRLDTRQAKIAAAWQQRLTGENRTRLREDLLEAAGRDLLALERALALSPTLAEAQEVAEAAAAHLRTWPDSVFDRCTRDVVTARRLPLLVQHDPDLIDRLFRWTKLQGDSDLGATIALARHVDQRPGMRSLARRRLRNLQRPSCEIGSELLHISTTAVQRREGRLTQELTRDVDDWSQPARATWFFGATRAGVALAGEELEELRDLALIEPQAAIALDRIEDAGSPESLERHEDVACLIALANAPARRPSAVESLARLLARTPAVAKDVRGAGPELRAETVEQCLAHHGHEENALVAATILCTERDALRVAGALRSLPRTLQTCMALVDLGVASRDEVREVMASVRVSRAAATTALALAVRSKDRDLAKYVIGESPSDVRANLWMYGVDPIDLADLLGFDDPLVWSYADDLVLRADADVEAAIAAHKFMSAYDFSRLETARGQLRRWAPFDARAAGALRMAGVEAVPLAPVEAAAERSHATDWARATSAALLDTEAALSLARRDPPEPWASQLRDTLNGTDDLAAQLALVRLAGGRDAATLVRLRLERRLRSAPVGVFATMLRVDLQPDRVRDLFPPNDGFRSRLDRWLAHAATESYLAAAYRLHLAVVDGEGAVGDELERLLGYARSEPAAAILAADELLTNGPQGLLRTVDESLSELQKAGSDRRVDEARRRIREVLARPVPHVPSDASVRERFETAQAWPDATMQIASGLEQMGTPYAVAAVAVLKRQIQPRAARVDLEDHIDELGLDEIRAVATWLVDGSRETTDLLDLAPPGTALRQALVDVLSARLRDGDRRERVPRLLALLSDGASGPHPLGGTQGSVQRARSLLRRMALHDVNYAASFASLVRARERWEAFDFLERYAWSEDVLACRSLVDLGYRARAIDVPPELVRCAYGVLLKNDDAPGLRALARWAASVPGAAVGVDELHAACPDDAVIASIAAVAGSPTSVSLRWLASEPEAALAALDMAPDQRFTERLAERAIVHPEVLHRLLTQGPAGLYDVAVDEVSSVQPEDIQHLRQIIDRDVLLLLEEIAPSAHEHLVEATLEAIATDGRATADELPLLVALRPWIRQDPSRRSVARRLDLGGLPASHARALAFDMTGDPAHLTGTGVAVGVRRVLHGAADGPVDTDVRQLIEHFGHWQVVSHLHDACDDVSTLSLIMHGAKAVLGGSSRERAASDALTAASLVRAQHGRKESAILMEHASTRPVGLLHLARNVTDLHPSVLLRPSEKMLRWPTSAFAAVQSHRDEVALGSPPASLPRSMELTDAPEPR